MQNSASHEKGKGSIVCVSGEQAFGKTYLLRHFDTELRNQSKRVINVDCQAPIGKFDLGKLQPLYPFARVVEKLLSKGHLSAKKRFALNVGMTSLTMVPILGDLVYAVKEYGRDWRQYRREKSSEASGKLSGGAADFYDAILSYADKKPLTLLLDNMHYADAQSVDLLNSFADIIEESNLLIVLSYQKSVVDSQAPPLSGFLSNKAEKVKSVRKIDLKPFDQRMVRDYLSVKLPEYGGSEEFERDLLQKSYGVPGAVAEYVRYFRNASKGDPKYFENIRNPNFLPASLQSAFGKALDEMTGEERNILSICSAEGVEFTALIVSELLNTDILDAIQKLRQIQNKSGLIRSVGAKYRYGVKTTTYEFTQTFYQKFFEDQLEYEEYVALHGRIASLLKDRYDNAESEGLREEIAPYIAAHSAEAEDPETAKSMLIESAKAAQNLGGNEIVKYAYAQYQNLDPDSFEDEDEVSVSSGGVDPGKDEMRDLARAAFAMSPNSGGESGETIPEELVEEIEEELRLTFEELRESVVNLYHDGAYKTAAETAENYVEKREEALTGAQRVEALALAAKCRAENSDLDKAKDLCDKALTLTEHISDEEAKCLLYNSCAVVAAERGFIDQAFEYLRPAAQIAVKSRPDLRAITLANIALFVERTDPNEARRYFLAAKKLLDGLGFKSFSRELFDY